MTRSGILEDCVLKNPCEPRRKEEYKWDVYGKNVYCHKVHNTNWWYHREGYPKDHDDVVHAAYDRLGTMKEDKSHWITETMEEMEAGRGDPELNDLKKKVKPIQLLTFLSYPLTLKTRKDLLPEDIRKILPSLPRDQLRLRYTTTNQAHYKKVHIIPK